MAPTLRHLRLAALLLQETSLSKVARRLGVTQPTASRVLRELEEHLQVRLVERCPQGIRLTAHGRRVADRSAAIVADADDLLSPLHPEPGNGPLVCFAWNGLEDAVSAAMTAWQEEYPQSPCRLRQTERPTDDILEHRADLALTRGAIPLAGLTACRLYEEGRLATLPITSPIADYTTVTLEDLAHLEFVSNTTSGTAQITTWPAGIQPTRLIQVTGFEEWAGTISASRLRFGLTPDSTARHYPHPNLRYIPVLDAPPVATQLVWRKGESRYSVKHFIHLVREAV